MIYFKNEGLIPVEGFTTMGVNVKENIAAIGHFGTGLKIAIASILRLGGTVTIKRGLDSYVFKTKSATIRGKDFDIVTYALNNVETVELGYTTDLGKNWEPWMVMRELESNCRDEHGESGKGAPPATLADTVIIVSCEVVETAWENRFAYFLETRPIYRHHDFEIHKRHPDVDNIFFYQGIKVGKFPGDAPFTFNFTGSVLKGFLTEDRTLPHYHVMSTLGSGLPEVNDQEIVSRLWTGDDLEGLVKDLDYDYSWSIPSEEFFSTILNNLRNNRDAINPSLKRLLINHEKLDRTTLHPRLELDDIEKEILDFARQYVTDLGFDGSRYPIFKAELPSNTHGLADTQNGEILISAEAFLYGKKYVASTVFEEQLHIDRGFGDCTRSMQNYLFEKLITVMEKHYYKKAI